MGQRFPIIENTGGKFKVYHVQWLWGAFAIRRIGTAVKNFVKYNGDGFRSFEDFLKGSFYGKPDDMNSFDRYYSDSLHYSDNKEMCAYWKGKNKKYSKEKKFSDVLKSLDNNDGYFYIDFSEKFLNGQKGIRGYCFIPNAYDHYKFKFISADQYMKAKWYNKELVEKNFTKKQVKEYSDDLIAFRKLPVINPPKKVTYGEFNL